MSVASITKSSLVDGSTHQPTLTIGSAQPHELIWSLVNTAREPGQDLVVTPFPPGTVGPDRNHFAFSFEPGALTAVPRLTGWDVAVRKDDHNAITCLYIALTGNEIKISPEGKHSTTLAYTTAIQKDRNDSNVIVKVTAGTNVAVGGKPIKDSVFGPFDLKLVPAGATRSAPPISVAFVGRRTVLNDGLTMNNVTFALTNMMDGALELTPEGGGADTHPAKFTVWFDPALAKAQALNQVALKPPGNSTDWSIATLKPKDATDDASPHHQWIITVAKAISLEPQEPVVFTFTGTTPNTGFVTDLDPGLTRMYLRYEGLPGSSGGVLIAELEKTPLSYGASQGQGLYVSAGQPQGATPPVVNYASGLHVHQFAASRPAATFEGGTGVTIDGPLTANKGATITGDLTVTNQLHANATYFWAVGITDPQGHQYRRCWIGMFEREGKKYLHIGGITDDDNTRRMMIVADKALIQGNAEITGAATVTSGLFTASNGATISGPFTANTGATVTGGVFTASNGATIAGSFAANNGATITGGLLTATNGATITGSLLTAGNGATITGSFTANSGAKIIGNLSVSGQFHFIDGDGKPYTDCWIGMLENDKKKILHIGGITDTTDDKRRIMIAASTTVITGDVEITGGLWALATGGRTKKLIEGSQQAAKWQPTPFPSDLRFKTEVQSVPCALDKVRRMRGVTYRWNEEALRHFNRDIETTFRAGLHATAAENEKIWQTERDKRREDLGGINVGVLAQDIEAVLPEAVSTDDLGYKSVRYHQLTALLIEAVKEMDRTIKDQAARLAELEAAVARLTSGDLAPNAPCDDFD